MPVMDIAMDLVTFLRDRLAEDEAAAKAAPGCRWQSHTEADIAGASVYDEQWVLLYPERYDHDNALSDKPGATGPMYIQRARDELVVHVARHDPARVLREVEAKRTILAVHEPNPSDYGERPCCSACWPQPQIGTHPLWPCSTVRAIAAVYSDHPDYDEKWRP